MTVFVFQNGEEDSVLGEPWRGSTENGSMLQYSPFSWTPEHIHACH